MAPLEKLKEGPLAAYLARNRDRCNARFARATAVHGGLDAGEWARLLLGPLDRIAREVASAAPAAIESCLDALYDVALQLLSKGLLGESSRVPAVAALWRSVLPALSEHLAAAPRKLAARLSNACCELSTEDDPAIAERWLRAIAQTAPGCKSPDDVLDAGKVLAWTCGAAHYRDSALETWRRLSGPLRRGTLGLPAEGAPSLEEVERALADPWCALPPRSPSDRRIAVVGRVGGFRGLGGKFVGLPRVVSGAGALFAHDGSSWWSIHADSFGSTLRRAAGPPPFPESSVLPAASIGPSGEVRWGASRERIAELGGSSSQASTESTLAVTLPRSYCVFLVARR